MIEDASISASPSALVFQIIRYLVWQKGIKNFNLSLQSAH